MITMICSLVTITYFCDDNFKYSDLLQLGTHGEVDIPLTPTENVELGSSMKKQGDDEPKKFQDPRAKPEPTAGMWAKFKWAIMYPLYTLSALTIPGRLLARYWFSLLSFKIPSLNSNKVRHLFSFFRLPKRSLGKFFCANVSNGYCLDLHVFIRNGLDDYNNRLYIYDP